MLICRYSSVLCSYCCSFFFRSGAYGQSKFANILFSNELSHRALAAGTGLTANAVHPGFINTDLDRHLTEGISGMGAYLAPVLSLAHKWVFSAAMETDSGALTQVRLFMMIFASGQKG